jgi:hypothetical protein
LPKELNQVRFGMAAVEGSEKQMTNVLMILRSFVSNFNRRPAR